MPSILDRQRRIALRRQQRLVRAAQQPCPTHISAWHALIVEHTTDLVALLDETGCFIYASPSYQSTLGYDPQALLGVSSFALLHAHDLESVSAQWMSVQQHGQGHAVFRYQHADGRWRWIETHATIITGAGTSYAIAVSHDITERKALEERNQLLATANNILGASLDYRETLTDIARLVTAQTADCCIMYLAEQEPDQIDLVVGAHANPAKEPLMRHLESSYRPDFTNPASVVGQVIQGGTAVLVSDISPAALESVARDAEQLALFRAFEPCSGMVIPLKARDRVIGAMAFLTSESQRRYGPQDLEWAEELANRAALAVDNARLYQATQEAVRVRDQFLSIASHELKTPLTALLGNLRLLQRRTQRDTSLGARDQRTITLAIDQAKRLNKLIGDLLDNSRLETGQLQVDHAIFDLPILVLRAVDEVGTSLIKHTIHCAIPAHAIPISGDELRMEQVLHNLLHNAVKYSPAGGQIEVSVELEQEHVSISISDPGIGIPAQSLPHLFTRFYRADNVMSHGIPGMGVGLYIIKEIITLHGGTVSVSSIEGSGSTFTITLPQAL